MVYVRVFQREDGVPPALPAPEPASLDPPLEDAVRLFRLRLCVLRSPRLRPRLARGAAWCGEK